MLVHEVFNKFKSPLDQPRTISIHVCTLHLSWLFLSLYFSGPLLLQDHVYIEEIAHFDRERIPERVVHAKGAGAFGYFEVTHDITKYCKVSTIYVYVDYI